VKSQAKSPRNSATEWPTLWTATDLLAKHVSRCFTRRSQPITAASRYFGRRPDGTEPSGLTVGRRLATPISILMPGTSASTSLPPEMRLVASHLAPNAGIHAALAALELCTAHIDARAKGPSSRTDLLGIRSPYSGSPNVISMMCKCPVRLQAHALEPAGIPRMYLIDIREDYRMRYRSRLGRPADFKTSVEASRPGSRPFNGGIGLRTHPRHHLTVLSPATLDKSLSIGSKGGAARSSAATTRGLPRPKEADIKVLGCSS
jgi:hypothetical protein